MQAQNRRQVIERLQAQIERVKTCSLPDGTRMRHDRQYEKPKEQTPENYFAPAPAGLLHEVWADETRNGGLSLGFALGQALALLGPQRLTILWLQLSHEAQQTGLPYGAGLTRVGLSPDALIIGRVHNVVELLWAAEEAAGCAAVAAVIVDIIRPGKILDFTASRRLSIRARRGGASIFLMRYGQEREASATHLRWHVAPAPSVRIPFDVRAPGRARWQVSLEKGHSMAGGVQRDRSGDRSGEMPGQMKWILNWTENGFAREQPERANKSPESGGVRAALSGALSSPLGYGLSETA